jgi:hypothetical protein
MVGECGDGPHKMAIQEFLVSKHPFFWGYVSFFVCVDNFFVNNNIRLTQTESPHTCPSTINGPDLSLKNIYDVARDNHCLDCTKYLII